MNLPVQRMPVARSLGQTRLRSGGVVASEGMIDSTISSIENSVVGLLPMNSSPCTVATATAIAACGGGLAPTALMAAAMAASGGSTALLLMESAGLVPVLATGSALCLQAVARARSTCTGLPLPTTNPATQ